jgi:hypothetical protein
MQIAAGTLPWTWKKPWNHPLRHVERTGKGEVEMCAYSTYKIEHSRLDVSLLLTMKTAYTYYLALPPCVE